MGRAGLSEGMPPCLYVLVQHRAATFFASVDGVHLLGQRARFCPREIASATRAVALSASSNALKKRSARPRRNSPYRTVCLMHEAGGRTQLDGFILGFILGFVVGRDVMVDLPAIAKLIFADDPSFAMPATVHSVARLRSFVFRTL